MPPRLADRLREHLHGVVYPHHREWVSQELIEEAAAALDRTEALEQALKAWAHQKRQQGRNISVADIDLLKHCPEAD